VEGKLTDNKKITKDTKEVSEHQSNNKCLKMGLR
jgi:hypothetical protein